jgi:hypothetical protein
MSDYQLTIGGLTLGAGTDYQLPAGPAGFGLPELRTSDTPRPQDHGLFWGNDYFGKRTITFGVAILGDNPDDATAKMEALTAVWQPPDPAITDGIAPLTIDIPGQDPRTLDGRPRRAAYNLDSLRDAVIQATLQYDVADPRWYDAVETVLSTAAATSGGGRTYDRVYPLVYAAGGTGGNLTATNAGNFPTRPVLTITGPCTTPRVENVTAGRYLLFDLTLGVGDFLVVDLDARTILLGGTASRYSSLVSGSSWWELAPGDNLLKFTSADSMGTLEVRYRSAWL